VKIIGIVIRCWIDFCHGDRHTRKILEMRLIATSCAYISFVLFFQSVAPLFSDGNPPPFGDWGQPAAPAPTPAVANPAVAVSAPAIPTGGDPIAILDASQAASVNAIAAAIPDLAPKLDLAWTAEDGVTVGGCAATLDARDAPGKSNIAWFGNVCVKSKLSSLAIFNGPLTDVPHLLSRCCIHDNKLFLALDFRPRAYGAYELVDADGNYPGPDQLGRKAFEYSGARNEFNNKFGTADVVAFLDAAKASFESAATIETTELDLLTGGPLALSVSMPVTDANVAAVASLREKAAAAWVQWALEDQHGHRPGAPVNTQYVYDSKFRQNAYSALLPFYSKAFGGDDGAKLAAAESGPLDEGYVGGGS
jgi:hypothetical protein